MKLRFNNLVMGSVLTAILIAVASMGVVLARAAGDPAAGKTVFTSSGCGGCHTLADAGATGKSASNLDTTKPGFDAIVSAVVNPPGGMPKSNLSDQQIQDLAAYIVAVAGQQVPVGGGPVGGGPGGGGGTGGPTSSTVRVKLKEWKIKVSPKQVMAGLVTFKIKNAGKRRHQFVVIRSSRKASALRVRRGRASEAGRVGKKIKKIRAKRRRKTSRTLTPGAYILIDNRHGNYKKGMFAVLTVTEPPSTGQGTAQGAGGQTSTASGPQLPPDVQAFLDAGCGGCHALADAGATGTSASSLDIGKPSLDTVADVVTNGITHTFRNTQVPAWAAMPAYNTNLTTQEVQDLASYISTVTGDGSTQTPGRQTVLRMGCGSCHTLADVDGKGTISTNLDITKPWSGLLEAMALPNGTCEADLGDPMCYDDLTNHMPAYEDLLTESEIEDAATYVDEATGEGAGIGGGCTACHGPHDPHG